MAELWRIEMLGGLRAIHADRVITRFRSRQTGALLAYLAFYLHRAHPREVLMEIIWPGEALDSARDRLRVALSSLRRQLEPPGVPAGAVIVADWRSVQLNPAAVSTDVAAFEAAAAAARRAGGAGERVQRLAEALDLYRGELLSGYYDAWILPEQQRLADLSFHAARELIHHQEQSGDLSGALDLAGRAVAADPLREEAHQELIRLYLRSAQPVRARQQFQELERLLREELGEAPALATRQLFHVTEPQQMLCPGEAPAPTGGGEEEQPPVPLRSPVAERPEREFPLLGAAACSTSSLPLQLTHFFGREAELASLQQWLLIDRARLITLTGAGGSGKTRLAVETAGRLLEARPGVVWWVSLVDLTDPGLIADAVRDAMRLPRSPQVPALEQVVEALIERRQPALLVLDNFEHLVEGGALVLRELLERAPPLQCLVTSRQLLNLNGEREFLVAPLSVPVGLESPVELTQFASVRLFVDRAQAVRPDFQVTDYNAPAVTELCQRLEGIPLAIELAAARIQMLTPVQMLPLLARRFELLVSRQRDRPARHRTLHTTIEWSYRLLSPELQRLFARLSVFRGGWTLEAAAAVCGEEGSRHSAFGVRCSASGDRTDPAPTPNTQHRTPILEALTQLQQSSLVVAEESDGEMRYRMPETLREYAEQQLDPEERAAVSQRHASYFLAVVEAAWPGMGSVDQGIWLDRLEREHDNLRAALDWCTASGEVETGLQMASRLSGFWMGRGYEGEGLARLTGLLALPGGGGTAARALALTRAGAMAQEQGDLARARALQEESLALARKLDDPQHEARALNNLGCALAALGEKEAARGIWQQYLALVRQVGDRGGVAVALSNLATAALDEDLAAAQALAEECAGISREIGNDYVLSDALTVLGDAARRRGASERARSHYGESLAIGRRHGNKHIVHRALDHLARLAREQGDVTDAKAAYRESLAICRELGRPKFVAGSLKGLGSLATGEGRARHAVWLFAAARSLYADPEDRDAAAAETLLAPLRTELGEAGFAAAWEEGRRTPLDEIVAAALSDGPVE